MNEGKAIIPFNLYSLFTFKNILSSAILYILLLYLTKSEYNISYNTVKKIGYSSILKFNLVNNKSYFEFFNTFRVINIIFLIFLRSILNIFFSLILFILMQTKGLISFNNSVFFKPHIIHSLVFDSLIPKYSLLLKIENNYEAYPEEVISIVGKLLGLLLRSSFFCPSSSLIIWSIIELLLKFIFLEEWHN